eukprot:CAMPEP_0181441918 /NCGR_PEP_ID=MMETSP1110-20121109/23757_1 /TAXON_ID=174948 /ORGANISM="Symbiodinium sp., Strain CCMP421" /LENGTH=100 /DNA_ID=CAMNT_0023565821 /DNA_START=218 /DNA_END=520 /DNA_ORIENTATION=-
MAQEHEAALRHQLIAPVADDLRDDLQPPQATDDAIQVSNRLQGRVAVGEDLIFSEEHHGVQVFWQAERRQNLLAQRGLQRSEAEKVRGVSAYNDGHKAQA